jgi:hypothetical protein
MMNFNPRLLARLTAAGLTLLALSGCGFHSMYADPASGPSVTEQLSFVQIGAVSEDSGDKEHFAQLVKNQLLDALDATGPGIPQYRLDVRLKLESEAMGFQPDETTTRVTLKLNADYTLTNLATGKIVFVNRAVAFNAYDVVRSDFATLSARQDSERRLVPEVSNQIMTRLGLYFRALARKGDAPTVKSPPQRAP